MAIVALHLYDIFCGIYTQNIKVSTIVFTEYLLEQRMLKDRHSLVSKINIGLHRADHTNFSALTRMQYALAHRTHAVTSRQQVLSGDTHVVAASGNTLLCLESCA